MGTKNEEPTYTAREAFRLGIPETAPNVTGELNWRKPSPKTTHRDDPAPKA